MWRKTGIKRDILDAEMTQNQAPETMSLLIQMTLLHKCEINKTMAILHWKNSPFFEVRSVKQAVIACFNHLFSVSVGRNVSTQKARHLPDDTDEDAWRNHLFQSGLGDDDTERLDITRNYKFKPGEPIWSLRLHSAPSSMCHPCDHNDLFHVCKGWIVSAKTTLGCSWASFTLALWRYFLYSHYLDCQ